MKQRLQKFRLYAAIFEVPDFNAYIAILNDWEPYILNAFDCPYSNAYTEGVNNTIKVVKRIA